MSAQYHSTSHDGVRTYRKSNGDIVQESEGPVPVFRGLAAAGGEAFISSDEESDSDYNPHQTQSIHQFPQQASEKKKKSKKDKKEKKEKKSKKDHACTCHHDH
ncbi:uncharacterized protein DFL_000769 [Arthrobotrys flagrans]|uniref:Uncharacterized protein n=1 Tax=Arthrobotrys flagrans TaxID=97331 RepID=A0A437AFA1_ARTFL|nr:hypothetical protein DFL_000769 [Arthrobotrys flagrans]